MYRMKRSQHTKDLITTSKDVFTTSDLAVLWAITNKNTLWTTIKRYINDGILFRIQKGLYSKIEPNKLNPYVVGCAIGGPYSYISTETILQKYGAIMQFGSAITVASGKTKTVVVNDRKFIYRAFKPSILLNRNGITDKSGYAEASKERAMADLNYLNPKYFIDNTKAIDTAALNRLKEEISYYDRS